MNFITGLIREIGATLRQMWNAVEDSGYCCGVGREPKHKTEYMPTPSSCCGVSV